VGRPELLFLDEPTAGFDPQARREFHDLLLRLTRQDQTTILLTTHDLGQAEKLAQLILILNRGQIIAAGTAGELARRIAGQDEVRWARDGHRFARSTADATKFVFGLFRQHGEAIADLEVRRASLEDTYLSLVHQGGIRPERSSRSGQGSREGSPVNPTTTALRAGLSRVLIEWR
jgi:ABC-2 type transport system ATP-binding protein